MNNSKKDWVFAAVLTVPMLIFFSAYQFYHPADLTPTGFIQYDNPAYVAFAKEYLDTEGIGFSYSNPFNDSAEYPRIYFQTQTSIIALGLRTGMPPGLVLSIFTIICSFACFRIIISIYNWLVPSGKFKILSCMFFAWGGGLFTLAGAAFHIFVPASGRPFWESLLTIDPGHGWWGLNFGRSLFFSCEAYYHLLFLAVVLCTLKRKWLPALTLSFILSISHPFTGIELLTILCAWLGIEKVIIKNKLIPWYFALGTGGILIFHLFYYLYYLNQFPDHKSVSEQYALNWYIRFIRMVPAYAILGVLALFTIYKTRATFFRNAHNRLFVCWALVAFLLAKHELFMKPMQPIHFTRGYIWTGLFLIALPALHWLLSYIQKLKYRNFAIAAFSIFFLLDNFTWIANYSLSIDRSKSVTYLTAEEKQILHELEKNSNTNTLIVGYGSEEEVLTYMAMIYTRSYAWLSHPYTTPFAAKKKEAFSLFISQGVIDPVWKNRELIFVFRKNIGPELQRADSLPFSYKPIIETASYKVLAARIP